jgi:hypothetical protein
MKRTVGLVAIAMLVTACGSAPAPTPPTVSGSPTVTTGQSSKAPAHAPHQLVIEVSGAATIDTLTYTIDQNKTDEHAVGLPWGKTFEFPYGTGRHTWDLELSYPDGTVNATATMDGQLVTNSSGSGGGTVHLDGDLSD